MMCHNYVHIYTYVSNAQYDGSERLKGSPKTKECPLQSHEYDCRGNVSWHHKMTWMNKVIKRMGSIIISSRGENFHT